MTKQSSKQKIKSIDAHVLILILMALAYWVVVIVTFVMQPPPETYYGTITDMTKQGNTYNLIIVNGTEAKRFTCVDWKIEENVFGKFAKEPEFQIGDDVKITYPKSSVTFGTLGNQLIETIVLQSEET